MPCCSLCLCAVRECVGLVHSSWLWWLLVSIARSSGARVRAASINIMGRAR